MVPPNLPKGAGFCSMQTFQSVDLHDHVTKEKFSLGPLIFVLVVPPALKLHQERTQVVCSNREARKRPAESNGTVTPALDLGHMHVVLKCCVCMLVVDLGIGMIMIIMF